MFVIPTADDLVDFIKSFTGSTNTPEIKECIFLAELSMRNIELPALRSDPYAPEYVGVVDSTGGIQIPADMNKPILFFKQGQQYETTATVTGSVGVNTITLTSAPSRNLTVGMTVSGTGIAVGANITNFTGNSIGSVITLSLVNTGAVSGAALFVTPPPASQQSQTGPWIVYDRIGDRDIITQGMIAQLYLQPVNVPAVIRGKFSEVGRRYKFLPYTAEGDLINMYYYKAWNLLFTPVANVVVSATATIGTVTGAGPWSATISGITSTTGLHVGNELICTAGTGDFGVGNTVVITSIPTTTSVVVSFTGGTAPTAGNITQLSVTNLNVQINPVLASWPEGYVYATLREYYIKRHNEQDASIYQEKFQNAWDAVEDQNNLGKWSGGHTRLTSVWQPRQYRQYNIK
jgi:hypothetical protein